MRITIPGTLPSLNDYTRACRAHRMAGAKMKQQAEEVVATCALAVEPVQGRVQVSIAWYEPTRRRDPDNVRFAVKFILDALVSARVLDGDSQRTIAGLADTFHHDPDNPRIEVTIEGCE